MVLTVAISSSPIRRLYLNASVLKIVVSLRLKPPRAMRMLLKGSSAKIRLYLLSRKCGECWRRLGEGSLKNDQLIDVGPVEAKQRNW
jgi:hypothetical protein